jgi:hypothetical protein
MHIETVIIVFVALVVCKDDNPHGFQFRHDNREDAQNGKGRGWDMEFADGSLQSEETKPRKTWQVHRAHTRGYIVKSYVQKRKHAGLKG